MKIKDIIFGSWLPFVSFLILFIFSIKKFGGVDLIAAAGAVICVGAWIITLVAKEYFKIGKWNPLSRKAFAIFANPALVFVIGSWTFYCVRGGLGGETWLMIVGGTILTLLLELFDFFKTLRANGETH